MRPRKDRFAAPHTPRPRYAHAAPRTSFNEVAAHRQVLNPTAGAASRPPPARPRGGGQRPPPHPPWGGGAPPPAQNLIFLATKKTPPPKRGPLFRLPAACGWETRWNALRHSTVRHAWGDTSSTVVRTASVRMFVALR